MSREYALEDMPLYREVAKAELLIIGTIPHIDINTSRIKKALFLQSISECQHVALETTQERMIMALQEGRTSHGVAALSACPGQLHFLYDGIDTQELAEGYGVRKDLFGLYLLLGLVPSPDKHPESYHPECLSNFIEKGLKYAEAVLGCSINRGITLDQLDKTIADGLEGAMHLDSLIAFGKTFREYLTFLGDYTVLAPRSRHFAGLPGRKALIVQARNVNYVEGCVKGETIGRLPPWPGFVGGLVPEQRCLVERIETELFPHKHLQK